MTAETKDSGVKWIGTVPADWEINKIKYIAVLKGRIGWQGLTSDEYTDEGAYLITGVDFENGGINWDSCVHVPMRRWEEARDIQIEDGDLLITKDGTIGKVAIVSGCTAPTSLNSGVLRISTIDSYERKFLYWVLQSDVFWTWFADKNAGNSTIQHLYQGDFAEFKYAIPPIDEQRAIASFLDIECAKIDSIIEDLEKQLEALKKLKKSIITQAVIKGINTAVSMKDSGVEWIGQIPRHWAISRLKYCCKVKTGPFGTQLSADEYTDGGTPIINVKNIGYGTVNEDDLDRIPDSVKMRLSTHILRKGDIVFGRKGAVDKHAIIDSEHDGWVQGSDCIRIRVEREIESSFLNYFFGSSGYGDYVVVNSVGSTMASINSDILNNSVVVFPDMQEQLNIVEYLNERTKLVNSLIAGKEKQLVQIRNHRKALIYEYVTGKKRIMEVASHAN